MVKNSGLAGKDHTHFKNITHIDLSRTKIELLFNDDVRTFITELGHWFKEFETYPGSVQLAMLDMAYTMGTGRFFNKFPKFGKALAFRNWIGVADESERSPIDSNGNPIRNMPQRNADIKGWILEAIRSEPYFINLKCPPKPLSMVP